MVGTGEWGYASPLYARSLAQFGSPRLLPRSGAYVLERRIPGTPYRDAMGTYPLMVCPEWSRLHLDLAELDGLVSLTAVSDPFGEYDRAYLRRCFPDLCVPFKRHHVADLSRPVSDLVSKHHRYYARKALERVRVERCADPPRMIDEWEALYANLVRRRGISGLRAFSRGSFERQLRVPGLVVFRATFAGEAVGAHLWYRRGEVAYSHLAATSRAGHELMASYALYRTALDYFAGRVRYLDLGAGAGVEEDRSDGLDRFKRGWSNTARTAYLLGRVLDRDRYEGLLQRSVVPATRYFPAYRAGEFE